MPFSLKNHSLPSPLHPLHLPLKNLELHLPEIRHFVIENLRFELRSIFLDFSLFLLRIFRDFRRDLLQNQLVLRSELFEIVVQRLLVLNPAVSVDFFLRFFGAVDFGEGGLGLGSGFLVGNGRFRLFFGGISVETVVVEEGVDVAVVDDLA